MANVNKASTKGVVNSIEAGANSSNAMMYGSVSALQNSLNGSGNIHVAALPESVVSTGPVPSQLGAQGASTVLANLNGSLYMNNGQPSSVISSVNTSFNGTDILPCFCCDIFLAPML